MITNCINKPTNKLLGQASQCHQKADLISSPGEKFPPVFLIVCLRIGFKEYLGHVLKVIALDCCHLP